MCVFLSKRRRYTIKIHILKFPNKIFGSVHIRCNTRLRYFFQTNVILKYKGIMFTAIYLPRLLLCHSNKAHTRPIATYRRNSYDNITTITVFQLLGF